jgi:pimeloyl-ACP methyl ester carboxylesterase
MPPPSEILLEHGRRLAYDDLGDPAGVAVVWCHGGLSSRLDAHPGASAARTNGVRFIAPDRPGVGRSARDPGRSLLDWPADVAALADALSLERFAVIGWSLGGPFAAACAHAMPSRVTALGLVAACIPCDWDGMREEINGMDRRFMKHSKERTGLLHATLAAMRLAANNAPAAFTRATVRGLSPSARAPLDGEKGRWFARAVAEGLRDPGGVVDEYRIMAAPWGFDPSTINVPTFLWQGVDDSLVPATWAGRLATAIPGSSLACLDGAGHFLAADHFAEILQTVAATERG